MSKFRIAGATTLVGAVTTCFIAALHADGIAQGDALPVATCNVGSIGSRSHSQRLTTELLLTEFNTPGRYLSPTWIPGSADIVFPITVQDARSEIDVLETSTGLCHTVGHGTAVLPSPDGKLLAYISEGRGGSQVYVMRTDGSEVRQATRISGGVEPYAGEVEPWAWSADSSHLAFGFQAEDEHPLESASSKVTAQDFSMHESPPDGTVQDIDLRSGTASIVAAGPYRPFSLSWRRRDIVFQAVHFGDEYHSGAWWGNIKSVDPISHRLRTIVADRGVQFLQPSTSKATRLIAFCDDPTNIFFPFNCNIATVDPTSRQISRLTTNASFPHYIHGHFKWAPNAKSIYFLAKEDVFQHIYNINSAGTIRKIDRDEADVLGYDVSGDGKRIVWTAQDAYGHNRLVVADADGSRARTVLELRPDVDNLELGHASVVHWHSRDGLPISGLVILPPSYTPRTRYPVLVDVHGGPTGGISLDGSLLNRNALEWHMWATKGYIVLVPDYRSSEVSGWDAFLRSVHNGDLRRRDYEDIMSGADYTIHRYSADPARLAIIGHSNGGLEVNWIITHTHRFRAAISYEGWADEYLGWSSGARIGGNPAITWMFGGTPWNVSKTYFENSPAMHVAGVTTPTLFISGEHGIATYHNEFMYGALLNQGVPTDLVVYGGELHVIESAVNQRDLLTRAVKWIDKYTADPH